MQELQDKIVAAFGGMVSSGKLDTMIEEKLGKCVEDILQETLRSWSPFGKALSEGIDKALNVNVDELGLAGYNDVVGDMIKAKLDSAIAGEWRVQLEADIDKMLRAAPESIKMSEIIKQLQEEHEDDAREGEWEGVSLHVRGSEYSSNLHFIDVDPEPDKADYECQWKMVVTAEGKLSSVRIRGTEPAHVLMGRLRGFELLLFQLRAGKTRIEVDVEDREEFCYDLGY